MYGYNFPLDSSSPTSLEVGGLLGDPFTTILPPDTLLSTDNKNGVALIKNLQSYIDKPDGEIFNTCIYQFFNTGEKCAIINIYMTNTQRAYSNVCNYGAWSSWKKIY